MPREENILVVAPSHTHELADRMKDWGWNPLVISLEWWLGPEDVSVQASAVIIDVDPEYSSAIVGRLLRRGLESKLPTLWLTDEPPALDLLQLQEGEPIPLVAPRLVGAPMLHWLLELAYRQQENRQRYVRALEQAGQLQDVTGRLGLGIFRFGVAPPQRFTPEMMSPRAEELVDRRFTDLMLGRERWIDSVVADEKPVYRAFLDSLIERPRVTEIRVHRLVRGEVRTLRERYDAAVWSEGRWVFQGIIEDASEERPRNSTGDRALEVLKDLRETMKFLDAEASTPAVALSGELSAREREVYQLIRSGISNALIAVRLGCAESTVKKHVSAIFDKMGVHTRAQLLTLE